MISLQRPLLLAGLLEQPTKVLDSIVHHRRCRRISASMNESLLNVTDKYLLLTEFEVCTVSYGPSFFPLIYDPSAKRAGHTSTGQNEDS